MDSPIIATKFGESGRQFKKTCRELSISKAAHNL